MIEYSIDSVVTGEPLFTAAINCNESATEARKKGLAARWAVENKISLAYADLIKARLVRADLHGVDLRGANLCDADLGSADLRGANMRDAFMLHATFCGANMMDADLRGAVVAHSSFLETNLQYADLRNVTMWRANFAGARGVVSLGCPNRFYAFGWWRNGIPWVQVGCRSKSVEDARAYWRGKKNRREVMAALDYFDAIDKIRNRSEGAECRE